MASGADGTWVEDANKTWGQRLLHFVHQLPLMEERLLQGERTVNGHLGGGGGEGIKRPLNTVGTQRS